MSMLTRRPCAQAETQGASIGVLAVRPSAGRTPNAGHARKDDPVGAGFRRIEAVRVVPAAVRVGVLHVGPACWPVVLDCPSSTAPPHPLAERVGIPARRGLD